MGSPDAADDWPAVAARLAAALPRAALEPSVVTRLDVVAQHPAPWAVACSGGADSVALLLLAHVHWGVATGRKLVVLHYDHATRAGASARDAAFVANLAKALGYVCVSERRASGEADAPLSEAMLRAERLRFFEKAMGQLGVTVLLQGHQADDVAETLLMRLARGSGTAGLSAPRPLRDLPDGRVFLRPLLTVSRQEIRESLAAAGGAWCEDVSNNSALYFRNRVRSQVLPKLEEASGRNVVEAAGRTRRLLEEDDAALEAWLRDVVPEIPRGPLALAALNGRPRALWRRAIHKWLTVNGLSDAVGASAFELLLEAAAASRTFQLGVKDGFAAVEANVLHFRQKTVSEPWAPASLGVPGVLNLPGEAQLTAEWVALTDGLKAEILAGRVDPRSTAYLALEPEAFEGSLTVRRWEPGDRFRHLGAPGRRKLQDIFTDKQLSAQERNTLPLVLIGHGAIAWVPGLPPAHDYRITPAARAALRLTYRRANK